MNHCDCCRLTWNSLKDEGGGAVMHAGRLQFVRFNSLLTIIHMPNRNICVCVCNFGVAEKRIFFSPM